MRVMTVEQYQAATDEVRALQSEVAASELAALRKQIAALKTLQGKTAQRSRAHQKATEYIQTAILADVAARRYMYGDRYGDTYEMGRARLEAATAEYWGTPVEANKRRRKTPEHGDWNKYRAGCRCEECRKANAKKVAEYRAAKKEKVA